MYGLKHGNETFTAETLAELARIDCGLDSQSGQSVTRWAQAESGTRELSADETAELESLCELLAEGQPIGK